MRHDLTTSRKTKQKSDSLPHPFSTLGVEGIISYMQSKRPTGFGFYLTNGSEQIIVNNPRASYTETVVKVIEQLLAFDKDKFIDQGVERLLNFAVSHYRGIGNANPIIMEEGNDDDYTGSYDFPASRRQVYDNEEKVDEILSKLPKKGLYKLNILHYNPEDKVELMDLIERVNKRYTVEKIHSIIDNEEPLIIQHKKAFELYKTLRTDKRVFASIAPHGNKPKKKVSYIINGKERLSIKTPKM